MYTHLIQDTSASNCKLKLMTHKSLFKFLFSESTLNFAVQGKKKVPTLNIHSRLQSIAKKNDVTKLTHSWNNERIRTEVQVAEPTERRENRGQKMTAHKTYCQITEDAGMMTDISLAS